MGLLVLGNLVLVANVSQAQEELANTSRWRIATPNSVRQFLQRWADSLDANATVTFAMDAGNAVFDPGAPYEPPLLELNQQIAQWLPETQALAARLNQPLYHPQPMSQLFPESFWEQERYPRSIRQHWRLSVGVWLAQHEMYDEAERLLEPLNPTDVCAPAALLFYRGLAEHQLLKKETCLATLEMLLENEQRLPARFAAMGKLMRDDLAALEEDSLDEIARLMGEVRRRQSLYRSGQRVLNQEQEVVDKLNQLIEEIEQQLQQQQQQQMAQSNQPGSQPMEKSEGRGGLGDGRVKEQEFGEGGAWGNLPPKQRAAALTELAKDLPPHYREVIEEYFRQLAKESLKP